MTLLAFGTMAVVTACAKIEAPPGGPPDTAPPRLIGTYPESLVALPGFHGEAEFRFDEVVSEGAAPGNANGTGDLQRLILLSPTTRAADVSWKRSRITVQPGEGWQPNRTYRIELLPGVMDLRNNRATSARSVITFTTGGPLPADTLRGKVIDWTTGRPVPGALIEAVLQPDSLPYRIGADSAGSFVGAPLPAGTYVVYGAVDQNSNGRREAREAYDSVTTTGNGPAVTLWAFPHDTNPPRLQQATPRDSVTVDLQFSQPLSPDQRIDTGLVTVRHLPDSVVVPVAALATQRVYDSLRQSARPDSTRPDSVAPAAPPAARPPAGAAPRDTTPGRPPLSDRLILVLKSPMDTAGQYLVLVDSIRNVTGISGSTRAVFAAPKQAGPLLRPDSVGVDSLPRDSARPDSVPE
ncbi:MAG TPA: Ig-like domain-containing protein [Gemmatimonadales bacterium]|nr:Ig-like domain-containing protein [Gemmatimonadales bacterium]